MIMLLKERKTSGVSKRCGQVSNGPCEAERNALLFLMEIQKRLCTCAGQRTSRETANSYS